MHRFLWIWECTCTYPFPEVCQWLRSSQVCLDQKLYLQAVLDRSQHQAMLRLQALCAIVASFPAWQSHDWLSLPSADQSLLLIGLLLHVDTLGNIETRFPGETRTCLIHITSTVYIHYTRTCTYM